MLPWLRPLYFAIRCGGLDNEIRPNRPACSPPSLDKRQVRTYIEHMPQLDTRGKLAILADAAKYDASCASSGTQKRDSRSGKGIGSTEGMGICHAYAPDGRCISLLKILLTNSCIFDCHYFRRSLVRRRSPRAARSRAALANLEDTVAIVRLCPLPTAE